MCKLYVLNLAYSSYEYDVVEQSESLIRSVCHTNIRSLVMALPSSSNG